jgi:hypothetical protein
VILEFVYLVLNDRVNKLTGLIPTIENTNNVILFQLLLQPSTVQFACSTFPLPSFHLILTIFTIPHRVCFLISKRSLLKISEDGVKSVLDSFEI